MKKFISLFLVVFIFLSCEGLNIDKDYRGCGRWEAKAFSDIPLDGTTVEDGQTVSGKGSLVITPNSVKLNLNITVSPTAEEEDNLNKEVYTLKLSGNIYEHYYNTDFENIFDDSIYIFADGFYKYSEFSKDDSCVVSSTCLYDKDEDSIKLKMDFSDKDNMVLNILGIDFADDIKFSRK